MSYPHVASPGLNFNYSLYSVPAGWVVSMAPLWWAIGVSNKASPGAYNNVMPKESWEDIKDKLPTDLYRRVTRAVAANNNGHTNLALFAAAITAGNAARLSTRTLHIASASFILSRIAYNLAYIFAESPAGSALRSLFYFGGVGSCLTLFVKAANKYRQLPW